MLKHYKQGIKKDPVVGHCVAAFWFSSFLFFGRRQSGGDTWPPPYAVVWCATNGSDGVNDTGEGALPPMHSHSLYACTFRQIQIEQNKKGGGMKWVRRGKKRSHSKEREGVSFK